MQLAAKEVKLRLDDEQEVGWGGWNGVGGRGCTALPGAAGHSQRQPHRSAHSVCSAAPSRLAALLCTRPPSTGRGGRRRRRRLAAAAAAGGRCRRRRRLVHRLTRQGGLPVLQPAPQAGQHQPGRVQDAGACGLGLGASGRCVCLRRRASPQEAPSCPCFQPTTTATTPTNRRPPRRWPSCCGRPRCWWCTACPSCCCAPPSSPWLT